MTEEHKRKIGLANSVLMKKKWQDPEYIKYMSTAQRYVLIVILKQILSARPV